MIANDSILRMKILVRDFFKIPAKQIHIETPAYADRTYFIHEDSIVAIAKPMDRSL
jgi:hypothetical protein